MPEKLYPKSRRERDVTQYSWRIEYKLVYDGGGSEWSGYYRYKFQARVMAWWNVYISSWGGTAVLFNQSKGE